MKEFMHYLENQSTKLGIENNIGQINIRGLIKKEKVRFKSSKTILSKIRNLAQIKTDWLYTKILSRALNEGITEWAKQKTIPEFEYKTYYKEVNIVEQIENIIGAKDIIETVNRNPKGMSKLLNMEEKEFRNFCNEMDYIAFLDKLKAEIENSFAFDERYYRIDKFNEGEGKYLNDELILSTINVQNRLLSKLVIPYFEGKDEYNDDDFEKAVKCIGLIKEYCELANANTYVIEELSKTKEYQNLKAVLDKVLIQYAENNLENIDSWDRQKVFEVYSKYGLISNEGFDDNDNDYNSFMDFEYKIIEKMGQMRATEDSSILNEVKQKIAGKDKIDVDMLEQDYYNQYSSFDINDKVIELIINRKLTADQMYDLMNEVYVYLDCGKVISKKDIKKQKNEDGHTEYYVMVNGKKYTYAHLAKMKHGRKFLNSKQFEVIEKEDEELNNEDASNWSDIEEQKDEDNTALTVIDENRKGKIARFIEFLKGSFFRKKAKKTAGEVDSEKDVTEEDDYMEDGFRSGLKVKDTKITSRVGMKIDENIKDKDER